MAQQCYTIFSLLHYVDLSTRLPVPLVFSIVQFPNDACTSASSLTGTCLTSTECTSRSGSASGSCAAGFGVCCLVTTSTCSTTISQNNTYIQNPSYPSTYPTPTSATMCSYTINKLSDNICQLRLDFQSQELGVTAADGACTDTFQATLSVESSSTTANPSICGTNTGQHMYLHMGRTSTTTAKLEYNLASGTTSAKWNVLVQQIECDAAYAAPDACTQYLTGVSNTWSTYGYDDTGSTEILQGQSYKVCMRKEAGYCSITHSPVSTNSFGFSSGDESAAKTMGERGATTCYLDFLGIPGGYTDGTGAETMG